MKWKALVLALTLSLAAMLSWAFVEKESESEHGEQPSSGGASQASATASVPSSDPREADEPSAAPTAAGQEPLEADPDDEPYVGTPEEAQALIRPLIGAIRGRFANDAERREAMLQALDRSGSSSEAWTAYSASTLDGLRHAMRDIDGVDVDARHTDCFRAGCQARVLFRDEAAYRNASQAFRDLSEDHPQHGGRIQTPAVPRPDGTWEGNWILLRPT